MKYRTTTLLLALITFLIIVFPMTGCNDIESTLLGDQVFLVPASYDGLVAVESDSDNDWEWKVDPMPQGEYKYEWEIWSKSANGEISLIKSWEGYSGTAYYRFTKAGEYEIKVDIVNKSHDTIAEASSRVIIRNIILTASEDWIRPGQEAIFTIKDENPPKDPVYEWDFEDGSGIQWETDTTMRHVFEKAGWYNVCVKLREQGRTQYDYPGYLAVDSIIIHVGHPANLLVPQPPLYAGVKYEFTLGYNGELPTGHDYWWELSNGSARRTDSNTFEWTFPKEGTYTVRGEIRHHVSKDGIGKDEIFAFGQATVSVSKAPELTINVPPPPLQTGKEYTFMANHESPEKLADEPYYEWDFGDGSGIGIPFSNEATHIYDKEGTYTIRVLLFESDEEAAPLLGIATTKVEVEASANHLIELHQMKNFELDFAVQHDYVEGMSGRYSWDFESYGEVLWDGVNFSMQWDQYNHSEIMTGRVSEDGTVIEQLKIRHEFKASDGSTQWAEIEIADLPFWTDTMPDRFIVSVSNEDVQNYVVYFNTYRTAGYQWANDAMLYVRFTK